MAGMSSILGSNPLTDWMVKNNINPNILMQQSAGAPGFNPNMNAPTPYPPLPDKSPMTAMGPMTGSPTSPIAAESPQSPTLPMGSTPQAQNASSPTPVQQGGGVEKEHRVYPYEGEAQGIIRALSNRLEKITAHEIKQREKEDRKEEHAGEPNPRK